MSRIRNNSIRRDLSKRRIIFQFGTDDPEKLLFHYGWQAEVTQPGNDGASFGRYVEPSPSLEVPDVMRVFLVKANKID